MVWFVGLAGRDIRERRAPYTSCAAAAYRARRRASVVHCATLTQLSHTVHRVAPFSVGTLFEQPNPNVFCRAPFHDNHASGGWDPHIIIISTSLLTSYTHTIPHCCQMAPPAPASFTLVHIHQHLVSHTFAFIHVIPLSFTSVYLRSLSSTVRSQLFTFRSQSFTLVHLRSPSFTFGLGTSAHIR